jgi:hypothetical protein
LWSSKRRFFCWEDERDEVGLPPAFQRSSFIIVRMRIVWYGLVEKIVITYHHHNMNFITIGNAQRCFLLLDTIDGRRIEGIDEPGCFGILCVLQRLIDELDGANVPEVIAAVNVLDYPFVELVCALRVGCGSVNCVGCVLKLGVSKILCMSCIFMYVYTYLVFQ